MEDPDLLESSLDDGVTPGILHRKTSSHQKKPDHGGMKIEVDEKPPEDELFGLENQSSYVEILKVLFQQSGPLMVAFFLQIFGTMINLVFAGQFVVSEDSNIIFAGVSLAATYETFTWWAMSGGMGTAMETLGSQYNGSGDYREVGIILQRSCAILTTMALPIMVMWYFAYDVYRALGVEHSVCVVVRTYLSVRCLCIPADIFNECYEMYLMAIGVMEPSMWGIISYIIMQIAFNCFFVVYLQLGYQFIAFSWVLATYGFVFVLYGLSYKNVSVQRTLQPLDWAAWTNWSEFIALGLPSTVMLCAEWWAFEFLTFFATRLGTTHVEAQAIIMQILSATYIFPSAIGVAVTCLIGNCIGAHKIVLAKRIGKVGIICSFVLEIGIALVLLSVRRYVAEVFSSDPEVLDVTTAVIPYMAFSAVVYGVQGVGAGVIRGAGRQSLGAALNIVAYYIVGLPLAWLFCFHLKFELIGLSMGMSVGSLTQATIFFALVFWFPRFLYDSDVTHQRGGSHSGDMGDIEFAAVSTVDDDDDADAAGPDQEHGSDNTTNSQRSFGSK